MVEKEKHLVGEGALVIMRVKCRCGQSKDLLPYLNTNFIPTMARSAQQNMVFVTRKLKKYLPINVVFLTYQDTFARAPCTHFCAHRGNILGYKNRSVVLI